jgi:hypothetical protein
MRPLLATVLSLHGLAHLAGFRAAFRASAPQLFGLLDPGTLGARALGVVWLVLGLGYVAAAALLLAKSRA